MPIVSLMDDCKESYANDIVGDGEYWQPNDEKQNNHEAIVYVPTTSQE